MRRLKFVALVCFADGDEVGPMVVGNNVTLNTLDAAPSMNDTVLQDAAPTSVYLGFMEGSRFWIQRVLVPIVVSAQNSHQTLVIDCA
jgi:hypothetical protein